MYHPPTDHAIGHIRRQNAVSVGANNRLLEGKKKVGDGVQIPARAAPDVRYIPIGATKRLEMKRGLEFMIVRSTSWEKTEQARTPEHILDRICDEQVARLTVDIADAKDAARPQLLIDFQIANEAAGTRAGFGPHSRRQRPRAISDDRVVIGNGRSDEIPRRFEKT